MLFISLADFKKVIRVNLLTPHGMFENFLLEGSQFFQTVFVGIASLFCGIEGWVSTDFVSKYDMWGSHYRFPAGNLADLRFPNRYTMDPTS